MSNRHFDASPDAPKLERQDSDLLAPMSVDDAIEGPRPLNGAARRQMEPLFGEDFSGVRVEEQPAHQMGNALAVTQGNQIRASEGAMSQGTEQGRFLLGHELAHVVQQRGGVDTEQRKANSNPDGGFLEAEADEVGARVARGEAAGPISATEAGRVQAFSAGEHERMGNAGANTAWVDLAPGYSLRFGEVVALAGDHFSSMDQMRQFAANENGGPNSRLEIEYARKWQLKANVTWIDGDEKYESAKRSQEKRYYMLAGGGSPNYSGNASHFLNPKEGDMSRSTADKALDHEKRPDDQGDGKKDNWVDEWGGVGALGGYRLNHVRAILEAAGAGAQKEPIDNALAQEAFACHYLTDAFSGGHVRAARLSIQEYWDPKVPMFSTNIMGFMAETIAKFMIATGADVEAAADIDADHLPSGSVAHGATKKVKEIFAKRATLSFGGLVSLAVHDHDNDKGVAAHVNGKSVRLMGDGLAGKGDEERVATQAVALSVNDIYKAKSIGKTKTPSEAVVELYDSSTKMFRAEEFVPTLTQDDLEDTTNPELKWKFGTVEDLLANGRMMEAVSIFLAAKVGDLEEAKSDLSESEGAAVDDLAAKMQGDPATVIRQVINWTPDTGNKVDKTGNAQRYYMEAEKTEGGVASLTRVQRHNLIVDKINGQMGDQVPDYAIDMVMDLLQTCPDADARQIIQDIEWDDIYGYLSISDRGGSWFKKRFPKDKYG